MRTTRCLLSLVMTVSTLLVGCATGSQARRTHASGFLGEDRRLLQPGKPGEESLLVYHNPAANWSSYTKVLMEPVTIWTDPSWKPSADERKDLKTLAIGFQSILSARLAADYRMVDKPGPGVLRIDVAITNGQRANTPLKLVSIGVPYWIGASFIWKFVTGKPPFVGEASIESTIRDGKTGELLFAAADRRVGSASLVAGTTLNQEYLNPWGDVKYSLDFWSANTVYELCVMRGGPKCEKPKGGL